MKSPARKIKKSAVKNIVRFPAIKANSGKTILVESILESKFCLHLEFNSDVKTYFPQPHTFKLFDGDEVNTYTPDFEVHYTCGDRMYVEVKPLAYAQSTHYQQLFSRFEGALHDTNSGFMVVNEFDIYQQPLLSNYEKLYQYRKRPSLDMSHLHQSAEHFKGAVSLSTLVNKLSNQVKLREIYSWIALGYLKFDIRNEHLTIMTEVKFNV